MTKKVVKALLLKMKRVDQRLQPPALKPITAKGDIEIKSQKVKKQDLTLFADLVGCRLTMRQSMSADAGRPRYEGSLIFVRCFFKNGKCTQKGGKAAPSAEKISNIAEEWEGILRNPEAQADWWYGGFRSFASFIGFDNIYQYLSTKTTCSFNWYYVPSDYEGEIYSWGSLMRKHAVSSKATKFLTRKSGTYAGSKHKP